MERDAPVGHFQQLAVWLREEVQEFTCALRHRRDPVQLQAAVDRLRAALQTAEAAMREPRQRYQLSLAEQWGWVSAYAFVQEAKQELKPFLPLRA